MRYFKVISLLKFRLKRQNFSVFKIKIKILTGQNLGYDNIPIGLQRYYNFHYYQRMFVLDVILIFVHLFYCE